MNLFRRRRNPAELAEKSFDLVCFDPMFRYAGREPWGFRSRLAERYGVNRQRVSNIAASVGLTSGRTRV